MPNLPRPMTLPEPAPPHASARVAGLLRETIGLDAASIGPSALERTVRLRMKQRGLKNPADYLRLVQTSADEWEELLEAVLVTETWFFRDRGPFAALVDLLRRHWLPQNPAGLFGADASTPGPRPAAQRPTQADAPSDDGLAKTGPLRLLSVPCASGEEPYSLAMALLDAGFPPDRFRIDGVDLSARALARADRAVYGKNSFRGQDLGFRDRYFQFTPEGYLLAPQVRQCVQFRRANLFDPDFAADGPPYHVIFCRNLLIYFDSAARARALEKIARLLVPPLPPPAGCHCGAEERGEDWPCVRCGGKPGGLLFVGPAEMPLVTGRGFVSLNLPSAFACRKAVQRPDAPSWKSELSLKSKVSSLTSQVPPPAFAPRLPAPAASGPVTATARRGPDVDDLAVARELADTGRLAEAAAICQAHLERAGPSATAYYLLGLITEAQAEDHLKSNVPNPAFADRTLNLSSETSDALHVGRALDYYRKALYLEPDHYETLLHLALLLEKTGDAAGAQTYKRRAERAKNRLKS
jgi:chemotaxis protein methyltransferase WspC